MHTRSLTHTHTKEYNNYESIYRFSKQIAQKWLSVIWKVTEDDSSMVNYAIISNIANFDEFKG